MRSEFASSVLGLGWQLSGGWAQLLREGFRPAAGSGAGSLEHVYLTRTCPRSNWAMHVLQSRSTGWPADRTMQPGDQNISLVGSPAGGEAADFGIHPSGTWIPCMPSWNSSEAVRWYHADFLPASLRSTPNLRYFLAPGGGVDEVLGACQAPGRPPTSTCRSQTTLLGQNGDFLRESRTNTPRYRFSGFPARRERPGGIRGTIAESSTNKAQPCPPGGGSSGEREFGECGAWVGVGKIGSNGVGWTLEHLANSWC